MRLVLVVAAEAVLLLIAWPLAAWLDTPWPLATPPRALALGVAATVPSALALAWSIRTRWAPAVRIREQARDMTAPLLSGLGLAELAVVSLAAGLCEEVLFRGTVLTGLVPSVGLVPAWLISSLLFGLVHPASLAYVAFAVGAGLWFGGLFLLTGDLTVPVVAHAGHDLLAFVALGLHRSDPDDPGPETPAADRG